MVFILYKEERSIVSIDMKEKKNLYQPTRLLRILCLLSFSCVQTYVYVIFLDKSERVMYIDLSFPVGKITEKAVWRSVLQYGTVF